MNTINKQQKLLLVSFLLLSAGTLVQLACTKKHDVSIPVPVISGVSKTTALIGDTLIITGSQFSATPDNDLVAIAGVSLEVIAATTTQLSAVIPSGTRTGQLTVALPLGRPASYPDSIVIGTTGAPFITSITPATAYTGDTIAIHGGNFASPAVGSSVLIAGASCIVLNVSDSIIRLVVADPAYTGNVTVTSNGLVSNPYYYPIQKINPLEDGRFYWVDPLAGYVSGVYGPQQGFPGTMISRGADSATKPPYSSIVFQDNSSQLFAVSGPARNPVSAFNINNPIVSDAQGNYYFMNIVNTYMLYNNTPMTTYSVQKLSPSPTGFQRSTIWSETPDPNATTYSTWMNPPPPLTYDPSYPDLPDGDMIMDGNQLYIKIGITNTYLTADVSAASPVFTPTTGLVDDSVFIGAQCTPNYIFYGTPGSDNTYSLDVVGGVNYMQRGSHTSQTIPLPAGLSVLSIMADPSHGDDIIIWALSGFSYSGSDTYTAFYKFNAATQTLTKLYDPSNWPDANPAHGINPTALMTATYWAGSHIYYADKRRSYLSSQQAGNVYTGTGLYQLNDDGSSTRAYNVYPRLEPTAIATPPGFMYLFIGSK
jgi:IPT/TIG domain